MIKASRLLFNGVLRAGQTTDIGSFPDRGNRFSCSPKEPRLTQVATGTGELLPGGVKRPCREATRLSQSSVDVKIKCLYGVHRGCLLPGVSPTPSFLSKCNLCKNVNMFCLFIDVILSIWGLG